MGVLNGVRILDLSRLMPGPLCTVILGDLGADVIKVEQPEIGDYARSAPPFVGETGAAFLMLNRNKRSITLNLKKTEAREVVYKLAERSDVFVESYQPGVAERLHVGYQAIREMNERIIYCSISGYGQTGPYRDLVGHDLTYLSYAGAVGATGPKGGPPVIPAVQASDLQSAIYAAAAITAALYGREKTGTGEFIDISLMDVAVASMIIPLALYYAGMPTERGKLYLSGGAPFYDVYETADRRYISIAPLEEKFWVELCKTLGLERYEDRQLADEDRTAAIRNALAIVFRQKSRDEWIPILNARGIPCAPVYDINEVPVDQHVKARKMIVDIETQTFGRLHQLSTPIRMTQNPITMRLPPPGLGEHTLQILHEIGYSAEDAKQLAEIGAI